MIRPHPSKAGQICGIDYGTPEKGRLMLRRMMSTTQYIIVLAVAGTLISSIALIVYGDYRCGRGRGRRLSGRRRNLTEGG